MPDAHCESADWLRTLAHELTHVLQRRNALTGRGERGGAGELEHEAHRVARVVVAGRPVRCRLADQDDLPRAWMEAGHYYTVYYVLRAAGVTPETAARMAFFAQMPDEVEELDGFKLGVAMAKAVVINPAGIKRAIGLEDTTKTNERLIRYGINNHMGLHCLNGRDAKAETARRQKILMNLKLGDFKFGLALHPFGDSFAHRVTAQPAR